MTQKRAVCLNCMDGRVQIPVIDWVKDNCDVDHVDMITEAGMDGFLADNSNSFNSIKDKIDISIEKNNACAIAVVGHYDCKGNPVSDSKHKKCILMAVRRIKLEFPQMPVVGLWINSQWEGEKI